MNFIKGLICRQSSDQLKEDLKISVLNGILLIGWSCNFVSVFLHMQSTCLKFIMPWVCCLACKVKA